MTASMTRPEKYTGRAEALYLAFELSNRTWKTRDDRRLRPKGPRAQCSCR